jgi:hypothetical protein
MQLIFILTSSFWNENFRQCSGRSETAHAREDALKDSFVSHKLTSRFLQRERCIIVTGVHCTLQPSKSGIRTVGNKLS